MKWKRKTKDAPVIIVPEHEWSKLIRELQRAGYTRAAIAKATGLSSYIIDGLGRTAVKYRGRGEEPTWSGGQKLIEFITRVRKEIENETTSISACSLP